MLKNYNWENLKPGEGIFLPAIDVMKAREMGLRAAIMPRKQVYAKIGIKNGLIGVLFFIRAQPSSGSLRKTFDVSDQFDPDVGVSVGR
jgi:hypothetical protein